MLAARLRQPTLALGPRVVDCGAAAPGAKGEACAACEMVEPLGVSQPTVSHHLKILRQAGLVVSEKRGRRVYYRTVAQRLAALSRVLRA